MLAVFVILCGIHGIGYDSESKYELTQNQMPFSWVMNWFWVIERKPILSFDFIAFPAEARCSQTVTEVQGEGRSICCATGRWIVLDKPSYDVGKCVHFYNGLNKRKYRLPDRTLNWTLDFFGGPFLKPDYMPNTDTCLRKEELAGTYAYHSGRGGKRESINWSTTLPGERMTSDPAHRSWGAGEAQSIRPQLAQHYRIQRKFLHLFAATRVCLARVLVALYYFIFEHTLWSLPPRPPASNIWKSNPTSG